MSTEPWELEGNPSKYWHYNWYSDDVPARKFYLFLAEVGRRLRYLMSEDGPIKMIELCEQCAEGLITEDELSDLSVMHRPITLGEEFATDAANNLYWWVADRYKVSARGFDPASDVFTFLTAVEERLLSSQANFEEILLLREHPVLAPVRERTELEWGALVRDIYGPNPFQSVPFSPSWRTDTALTLAKQMNESRDFSAMPILADALQDAGCEDEAILNHCRDANQVHVRGCWVVDLVLGKK